MGNGTWAWTSLAAEGSRIKDIEGNVEWTCLPICEHLSSSIKLRFYIYFANSMTASVVCGAFSFFTSRMFRGGDGHWSDSKSLPFVSASVSVRTGKGEDRQTVVAWMYTIWELGEMSDLQSSARAGEMPEAS